MYEQSLTRIAAIIMALAFAFCSASVYADSGDSTCSGMTINKFGRSVDGTCDLTGDGIADILVGAPKFECDGGRVYIFSGADNRLVYVILGESWYDEFGFSVSCIGDVNLDGKTDFIVGAPKHGENRGKAYIYSGETFELIQEYSGEADGDLFGFSVSEAGDFCLDGCVDFVIGAPGALDGKGKVYVYRGCEWDICYLDNGEHVGDSLGYAVSAAGDANDDGHADIIVGAPFYDGIYDNNGRIYLISGYEPGGDVLCWQYGGTENAYLGWSVSDAGRINAGDRDDFLAGSPGRDNGRGAAYAFRDLPGLGELCDCIGREYGDAEGDSLGISISGLGDINSDNSADFISGAPGADNNKGKAKVFINWTTPDLWTTKCVIPGENEKDKFGYSVSGGGLWDGDDINDFLVGAIYAESTPPPLILNGPGQAYIYAGSDCSVIQEITDDVCIPGDANGDGTVNVGDAVYIISYVFKGGPEPVPYPNCSGDANCVDCTCNVGDAVYIMSYVFNGGPPPCDCLSWLSICGPPLRK